MGEAGYLDKLNDNQRKVAEFGVGAGNPPLLIIAGSGKTATLAHRVAHLLLNGADPQRILLMTFSRRAASELTARVARITAQAMALPSRPRRSSGPAPSTPSAPGSCASTRCRSG